MTTNPCSPPSSSSDAPWRSTSHWKMRCSAASMKASAMSEVRATVSSKSAKPSAWRQTKPAMRRWRKVCSGGASSLGCRASARAASRACATAAASGGRSQALSATKPRNHSPSSCARAARKSLAASAAQASTLSRNPSDPSRRIWVSARAGGALRCEKSAIVETSLGRRLAQTPWRHPVGVEHPNAYGLRIGTIGRTPSAIANDHFGQAAC